MSPLCFTVLLLFAATSCLVSADITEYANDLTPEKADIMFECMDTIACKLKHAHQIKRMVSQAGPKLFGEAIKWLSECYMLDPTDMELFWETYADKVCNQTQDKRRECTKECLLNFANYYEERCEEELDMEECPRAEATAEEILKIFEEYTATGDCNDPNEAAKEAEEMMEGGAKAMEDEFKGKFPEPPKPPKFG